MFTQNIAIDLGTANTIIIVDGQIVADDPLHSVAKGTGIALQNINNFSFLMNGN